MATTSRGPVAARGRNFRAAANRQCPRRTAAGTAKRPPMALAKALPPMLRRAQGREKARLRKKVKPPTRRPPEQVRPGRGSQPFPAFMAEHWSMSASMLIHFPKRRTGLFDMTRLASFADLAESYASITREIGRASGREGVCQYG